METEFDFSFDRPVYGEELLGGSGQLARASWVARRVRNDDVYFMQDGTLSHLLFKARNQTGLELVFTDLSENRSRPLFQLDPLPAKLSVDSQNRPMAMLRSTKRKSIVVTQ